MESPVDAARRAGSPWPEQMDRKMLRFVEKTRNSHRQNAPSVDRKCWQRLELGIHGLNRWTVKCLEMSRKRGVQTDKTPRARTESVGSALPRAELGTARPTRQASICYEKLRFGFSAEVWRAWFSAQLNIEMKLTSISLWTLVGRDSRPNCLLKNELRRDEPRG